MIYIRITAYIYVGAIETCRARIRCGQDKRRLPCLTTVMVVANVQRKSIFQVSSLNSLPVFLLFLERQNAIELIQRGLAIGLANDFYFTQFYGFTATAAPLA